MDNVGKWDDVTSDSTFPDNPTLFLLYSSKPQVKLSLEKKEVLDENSSNKILHHSITCIKFLLYKN